MAWGWSVWKCISTFGKDQFSVQWSAILSILTRRMMNNKVGLLIGVIALILAVPLAVIANLITPRCREWYSSRSRSRRMERIVVLKSFIYDAEHTWLFAPEEWEIFRANHLAHRNLLVLIMFILGAISAVPGALALSWAKLITKFGPNVGRFIAVNCALLAFTLFVPYFTTALIFLYHAYRYQKTRQLHSAEGREEIKNELAKLRAMNGNG